MFRESSVDEAIDLRRSFWSADISSALRPGISALEPRNFMCAKLSADQKDLLKSTGFLEFKIVIDDANTAEELAKRYPALEQDDE